MRGFNWQSCWVLWCLVSSACSGAGLLDWWYPPGDKVGRQNTLHPSPRCCYAQDCLLQDRGQHAFVTTLRTPEYLVLVRELHCSLMQHNPGARFIVAAVPGDLDPQTVDEVLTFAEYREVEDIPIKNAMLERFGKNWCKLRMFDWVDLDAIIMLDSDMVVRGDLQHVFRLPTDFAWTMDSGPGLDIEAGGFIFLRPCRAVARHMIDLIQQHRWLHFTDRFAEQDFLGWYFKYSGMRLSSIYNADSEVLQRTQLRTAGGAKPLVVHFAFDKPFEVYKGDPSFRYMCWRPKQPEQRLRTHSPEIAPGTAPAQSKAR